jgi:type II secretory pathway pseudopilin PulG
MTEETATLPPPPPPTLPRVLAILAVILVLALVLPYAAVRRLHQARLDAADRQAADIGRALRDVLSTSPDALPLDVELLEGPGARPIVLDERWTALNTQPLERVLRRTQPAADPWGNAWFVLARRSSSPRGLWVLTAGPDGIVQTVLSAPEPTAAGDDRLVRVP